MHVVWGFFQAKSKRREGKSKKKREHKAGSQPAPTKGSSCCMAGPSAQDGMSGLVKWGYWCLKYFIITVTEYIWFCLDWEASVHQACSVLQIWWFWAPATCCGPAQIPQHRNNRSPPLPPLLPDRVPSPGHVQEAGQGHSVPLLVSLPNTACPAQTLGHSGPWALPWPGLGEGAVPANGVGGSPAASQRSRVLQTMEAPAPHTSLSKEPCFWIIYATFRWKYFVFYSVDAFFFYNEALIKTNMCVILSGKYMLKCHFEYEIIHFWGLDSLKKNISKRKFLWLNL